MVAGQAGKAGTERPVLRRAESRGGAGQLLVVVVHTHPLTPTKKTVRPILFLHYSPVDVVLHVLLFVFVLDGQLHSESCFLVVLVLKPSDEASAAAAAAQMEWVGEVQRTSSSAE